MGVKRRREVVDDDTVIKDDDTPSVKGALGSFGGVWTGEHWTHALSHESVSAKQVSNIIQCLQAKNQTPVQVAMAILDTFPQMKSVQDCVRSPHM